MARFAAGVVQFQKGIVAYDKERFKTRDKGLWPEAGSREGRRTQALSFACSDSRMETSPVSRRAFDHTDAAA